MTWRISHYLNKGDAPYYPSEWGSMRARIINVGSNLIHISKIGIMFEWLQKEKGKWEGSKWWAEEYSAELGPGKETSLPPEGLDPVWFRIPIDIEPKSYTYKIGVVYEELIGGEWVSRGLTLGEKTHHILIKSAPLRDYSVFISHSSHPEDEGITNLVSKLLHQCGIRAYVSEKRAEPGVRLWSKIESAIKASDSILVLWTKYGAESGDVREEIGIAVGMGKYEQIIPIAEVELKGSLKGKEYSSLDRADPKKAVFEAIDKILKEARKKPSPPVVTSTS